MSDTLGFLLSDVSRLMRRRFDERARTIGATRAQWRALTVINRHEGINQGGLADLLEVEPITLCRMVDRLEDAALVERRRDPADRRAWQLFLTEKSRAILDQLRPMAEDVIGTALDGVTEQDQAILSAALNRIRENLQTRFDTKDAAHG